MLIEMRVVPTLSNGFMDAISLNVGCAVIVPIRGNGQPAVSDGREERVERVLGASVELFDVEKAALPHGLDERAVDKVLGAIALAQDAVGSVVADELAGREVGVPLDEHEGNAPFPGDGTQHRGLARARWSLEEYIAASRHGSTQELELSGAPDHGALRRVVARLRVGGFFDAHGPLFDDRAGIDREGDPGDVARLVRSKEEDGVRDVSGLHPWDRERVQALEDRRRHLTGRVLNVGHEK
jgi:hypothetical protein